MTREERHRILRKAAGGDHLIAHIHARVAEAPEPSDDVVEKLRRIMTRPAHQATSPRPAADAA